MRQSFSLAAPLLSSRTSALVLHENKTEQGYRRYQHLSTIEKLPDDSIVFPDRTASITYMVKDSWTYKKLRHFRAGIGGLISFLKRAFGVGQCRRKGLRSFKTCAVSTVVSANPPTLVRNALE